MRPRAPLAMGHNEAISSNETTASVLFQELTIRSKRILYANPLSRHAHMLQGLPSSRAEGVALSFGSDVLCPYQRLQRTS